jgi:hypothetical protein
MLTVPIDQRPDFAFMTHEGIAIPIHPITAVAMSNPALPRKGVGF